MVPEAVPVMVTGEAPMTVNEEQETLPEHEAVVVAVLESTPLFPVIKPVSVPIVALVAVSPVMSASVETKLLIDPFVEKRLVLVAFVVVALVATNPLVVSCVPSNVSTGPLVIEVPLK